LWTDLDGNKKAARDLRDLFDGKKVFDFPKPVALVKRMIQIAPNASDDDIILDFFAGSCATAQAVLELNEEDGGSRKFIMIQLPEPCVPGTEAYSAGYRTIAEIGRDRIKRYVASQSKDQSLELGASDTGLRAFYLAPSNFRVWRGDELGDESSTELAAQLEMHVDHLSSKTSALDILYELLLNRVSRSPRKWSQPRWPESKCFPSEMVLCSSAWKRKSPLS
jgi:adenine-specific DNA-methyltransferase